MKYMLGLLVPFFTIFISLHTFVTPVQAQTSDTITVHLFYSQGCPHCHKEKQFLEELDEKYGSIDVQLYEITTNPENARLYQQVGQRIGARTGSVPFTVVGNQYLIGYGSDESTGKEIEQLVRDALNDENYIDTVASIKNGENNRSKQVDSSIKVPEFISLPFFGEVRTQSLSLPVLTFVIAFLDGFNPCAMWVLVFLISMLLGMKDRMRMWLLGSAFIVTSGGVYFLFMTAWLNFFLFVGFIFWVRIIVGVFAVGVGAYYLWDYYKNKSGECTITGNEKRRKTLEKIKSIIYEQNFFLALGGIVLLALAVNIIEAICSAGLPAIYTQVLALSDISPWQYYTYILFYIIVFMIDDLFVFVGAMLTLHHVGLDTKYARYSHLVGGIIMLLIGLLLMFKPEFLMFG